MKWLFRPSVWVALSAALVVGAVVVWYRFRPEEPGGPTPLPIAPADREVVWLYQATSTPTWERFVTAVQRTAERLRDDLPGLQAQIDDQTFPRQSTAVPQVSLTWNGAGGRLRFRWYKLTSDWKPRDWVRALLKDRPPPLAIIGGNSSDAARDLAIQLRDATKDLDARLRPLLLLTTATADVVDWPADVAQPDGLAFQPPDEAGGPGRVRLSSIYPGRTFRFCFSNRQMSEAVAQFLWSRNDLRPDGRRIQMVEWNDDAYSRDLVGSFGQSLRKLFQDQVTFSPLNIYSSFGPIHAPNRFEVEAVNSLLDEAEPGFEAARDKPPNERSHPLLIVAGQTVPTRRFLRELVRTAPAAARHFVVATGDALAFNTVYRDRLVAWPIQDLPYPLVFFSHANPVDRDAGFRPHPEGTAGTTVVGDSGATGTEDVLLFADIVGAVARGATDRTGALADAPRLKERLASARYHDGRIDFGAETGRPLFGPDGDRSGGTGEYVVYLQPQFKGQSQPRRTLARATIEVWTWRETDAGRTWERSCEPLPVWYYQEKPDLGGVPHE